jgi:hypothetical protein
MILMTEDGNAFINTGTAPLVGREADGFVWCLAEEEPTLKFFEQGLE